MRTVYQPSCRRQRLSLRTVGRQETGVRDSYVFGADGRGGHMEIAIGFVIAVMVGLTGVGGGSFTTPMLVLVCGISGAEAVGTALVFSTVIKTVAAPFFLATKKVHFPYLRRMLLGAVPGLLAGTYLLAKMRSNWNPHVLMLIGVTLVITAAVTLISRTRPAGLRRDSSPWLPWLTLPIGMET